MQEPIFNLTPEELEIEAEFERGEYESVPNLQEMKDEAVKATGNTF